MLKQDKILTGYDNNGVVYDTHEFIIRKISSDYVSQAKEIYAAYQKFNVSMLGIVETEWFSLEQNSLKHTKYPISYPHEWSPTMFKQAALFHLHLFIELDKFGLTLKDAIPSNIVFDSARPVFVDFLSLLFSKDLIKESWLFENTNTSKDTRFVVFEKMFFPFIFVPLVLMSRKEHALARDMLLNRACNVQGSSAPAWDDLWGRFGSKNYFETLKLYLFFKRTKKLNFIDFCKELSKLIEAMDVAPVRSNYDSYYAAKKEEFPFDDMHEWKNKQRSVYAVIAHDTPKTVLDLGANTGWFSILAAKQGAKVIATDIDESCVDLLYLYAQNSNLNILSLMLPFDALTQEKHGYIPHEHSYKNRQFESNPLCSRATDRLKSDLVLCLALAHHLVLGAGKSIEELFEILSALTHKTLVLEFISLEDNLIKTEPSFFPHLHNYNSQNYTIDCFIRIGKTHFSSCEAMDSNPATRKFLVFRK
jgi:hypothetical protein